jgi:phosphoglycolate phosphatase-like HAD superfamily hydrolase
MHMPSPHHINPGLPLYEHMGISHRDYRDCKLAYRQGGLKRWMPVYEGAGELTHAIRRSGAEVWICTTRPYLRLDNIDPDTRHWLDRYEIEYDAVLFGEDKYAELIRQVGPDRVVAVCDDLKEQIAKAHQAGIPNVYLRDQPYNQDPMYQDNFPVTHRIEHLAVLQSFILDNIKQWRNKHDGTGTQQRENVAG